MKDKKDAVILLAEDDIADQELTKRALEACKIDNQLFIVNDGEEALDYLYRRNRYADPATSPTPDLLLLDLNMPKLNGFQVLETLKQDPVLKLIRIIVLTTSNQEQDILKSYSHGVASYISKPIDSGDFFRVISELNEYWFRIVKLPPKER